MTRSKSDTIAPTTQQLLEALEGARAVEKVLSDIARPPRLDPDDDDTVMAATNAMMERAYLNIVGRVPFSKADIVAKARAIKIMDEATGGAAIDTPNEHDAAVVRQIIDWLTSSQGAPQ
jgi:hypothetical protein